MLLEFRTSYSKYFTECEKISLKILIDSIEHAIAYGKFKE